MYSQFLRPTSNGSISGHHYKSTRNTNCLIVGHPGPGSSRPGRILYWMKSARLRGKLWISSKKRKYCVGLSPGLKPTGPKKQKLITPSKKKILSLPLDIVPHQGRPQDSRAPGKSGSSEPLPLAQTATLPHIPVYIFFSSLKKPRNRVFVLLIWRIEYDKFKSTDETYAVAVIHAKKSTDIRRRIALNNKLLMMPSHARAYWIHSIWLYTIQ